MMRESIDQWPYVIAAYVLAAIGTLLLVGWSWWSMRRAEKRREDAKRK